MKYAIGPRREMGIRSIFNILGPITNPAGAKRQVLGVFASHLTETLARVLGNLGAEDAMVIHGEDGLDEITITDGTRCSRYKNGRVENSIISPEDFGVGRAELRDISGGDKEKNAALTLAILKGEAGPRSDTVLMNSAAALVVAGKAATFAEGFSLAKETVLSGRALRKLDEVVGFTKGA
jgi:anthranilate phosphoribosyltransferase